MTRAKTTAPEKLKPEERKRIQIWARKHCPQLAKTHRLEYLWEQCRNWFIGEGKKKADWEHTFRNWILKADAEGLHPWSTRQTNRQSYREREYPQERRAKEKDADPVRLGEVVNLGDYRR